MMTMFILIALTLSTSVKRKASSLSLNLNEDLGASKEKSSKQGSSFIETKKQCDVFSMTTEFYYSDEIHEKCDSNCYFKIIRSNRKYYNNERRKHEVFKAMFNEGNYLPDYGMLKSPLKKHIPHQSNSSIYKYDCFSTFKLKCNCSPVKTECFFEMEILEDFKENIFLIKQDYDRLEEIEREMFESKTDEEYKAFSDKCCEKFIQILDSANSDLYYICIEAASLYIFFKKLCETKDYKKYKCLKTIFMLNIIVSNAKVDKDMRYFHISKKLACIRFKETNQISAETAFSIKCIILANFFTLLIQCLPNKRKLMYLYSNITIMKNQLFEKTFSKGNFFFHSKTSLVNILLNILFLMSKEELQEVIMNFESYQLYFLSVTFLYFSETNISSFSLFNHMQIHVIINYFLKIFNFYLNKFPSSIILENKKVMLWKSKIITYKRLTEVGMLKTMEKIGANDICDLTIKITKNKEVCATWFIYVSLDLYRKIVFAEFGIYHLTNILYVMNYFKH